MASAADRDSHGACRMPLASPGCVNCAPAIGRRPLQAKVTRANSKITPGLARNVLSLPAYAQEKPCCRDIRPIQSP